MPNSRGPRSNDRQFKMGRSRQQSKKPSLSLTRNRRNKHISSTQPTHRTIQIYNRCTSNTTTRHVRRDRKRNIRQIPFFQLQQNPSEPLEQFHSRIKQKAALYNWEDLEHSLVNSNFIQGMSNPQIQMDLLSEDRDPLETLHYAITR